jgi:hypothetical protein
MASLERFIEGRMRLKINQAKSAVARPEERHFLGFCLRRDPQDGVTSSPKISPQAENGLLLVTIIDARS